jgi:DNA-binding transcriptional MerR regulator
VMDQSLVSIGEAAAATGLSIKTIRYYEEIRLIPGPRRTNGGAHAGGRRLYSDADIGRLSFVRRARLLGLSLAEIRQLLVLAEEGCPSDQPEYRQILRKHLGEIDARVQHLLALRKAIKGFMSLARPGGGRPCSWGRCACMHPAGASLDETGSTDERKEGSDV